MFDIPGISIAAFVSLMKLPNNSNPGAGFNLQIAVLAAYFALNGSFTGLIGYRIYSIRQNAQQVLGSLRAALLCSYTTIFVESGAFFTVWVVVCLGLQAAKNWVLPTFMDPFNYFLVRVYH
jgi:hypothetical protein